MNDSSTNICKLHARTRPGMDLAKIALRNLNPIQDGPFRVAPGWERGGMEKGTPPLKSVICLSFKGENWHSYNLSKEDPKNI